MTPKKNNPYQTLDIKLIKAPAKDKRAPISSSKIILTENKSKKGN